MLRVFSGLTQIAVINSGALKSGSGRKERKKRKRKRPSAGSVKWFLHIFITAFRVGFSGDPSCLVGLAADLLSFDFVSIFCYTSY
jgi:hypothetical protein